jgi:uncharacterized protein (TIGR03382 family)
MNENPTSHQLGFQFGEYRFEIIRTHFDAYLAVDGLIKPAHAKNEIWIGKWYFTPSTPELAGIGTTMFLIVAALVLVILLRRRKFNPTT